MKFAFGLDGVNRCLGFMLCSLSYQPVKSSNVQTDYGTFFRVDSLSKDHRSMK